MTSPPDLKFTLLEMRGRHVRNVLRALVRLRAARGQGAGNRAALTVVAAELAAAIIGPGITPKNVDGMCAWIGFAPDLGELQRATGKAVTAREDPSFSLMSAAVIGRLVDFTAEEKAALVEKLKMKRIGVLPVDREDDRRRQRRNSEAGRRLARGATPRAASKAALARELGVDRTTLWRNSRATDSWPLPMGTENQAKTIPQPATVSWTQPGECNGFVDTTPPIGKGHESVASDEPPVPITNLSPSRKRTAT